MVESPGWWLPPGASPSGAVRPLIQPASDRTVRVGAAPCSRLTCTGPPLRLWSPLCFEAAPNRQHPLPCPRIGRTGQEVALKGGERRQHRGSVVAIRGLRTWCCATAMRPGADRVGLAAKSPARSMSLNPDDRVGHLDRLNTPSTEENNSSSSCGNTSFTAKDCRPHHRPAWRFSGELNRHARRSTVTLCTRPHAVDQSPLSPTQTTTQVLLLSCQLGYLRVNFGLQHGSQHPPHPPLGRSRQ